jgi:hypothetical protein
MNKNSNTHSKKISRRDALKLLTAAAGATALANLPARWSKPDLKVGVLPAHAQTSGRHVLSALPASEPQPNNQCYDGQDVIFSAVISPSAANILLQYVLTYNTTAPTGSITSPIPTTGTLLTNASGQVSLTATVTPDNGGAGQVGTLTIVWSFVNSSDGTNTVSQDVDIINDEC